MSIHQLVYETLAWAEEEALAAIGGGDIEALRRRRGRMSAFLDRHPWNESAFKAWLRTSGEWSEQETSRGLGDTIAKMTGAVGIKPCGGCKQRQAALNKIFPYKDER